MVGKEEREVLAGVEPELSEVVDVVEDDDVSAHEEAPVEERRTGKKRGKPVREAEAVAETLVRIVIPSQPGRTGSDDVFVSVNGRDFLIRRDAEVEVPPMVVEALNNAVATEYLTDDAGRLVGDRQVPRFPYRVLG